MNKIIRENYPAAKLPSDLRNGIDLSMTVTVTIEQDAPPDEQPMTLEQIFALRQPPYRSAEEILSRIRQLRDDWDD